MSLVSLAEIRGHGTSEHAPVAPMSPGSDDGVSGTAGLETSRKTTVEKCGT